MQSADMMTAYTALMESIKVINFNLNRLSDASEKLYQRIDVLEQDMQERSVKKKFIKSLIAFYPLLILLLMLLIDSDHQKISQVAADVSGLINDSKSLVMVAQNYDD